MYVKSSGPNLNVNNAKEDNNCTIIKINKMLADYNYIIMIIIILCNM